jgi:hypothetical protein
MKKLLQVLSSNPELYQLFRTADLLDIGPLKNTYAYFIAKRIYNLYDKTISNLQEQLSDQFGLFTEDQLIYIGKHLFLLQSSKEELSIADYIGLGGKISIYKDGTLNLVNKGLTSLQRIHLLKDVDKVKILDLSWNFLLGPDLDPEFPTQPFQNFMRLEIIDLSFNKFKEIPQDVFQGLTKLRSLHLGSTQLIILPERVFQGLTNLDYLDLDNNKLTSLPEHVFQGLTNLRDLNLSKNQLTSLPKDVFKGLASLSRLGLHSNQLTLLPDDVFQELTNLRHLWLYLNKLEGTTTQQFRSRYGLANTVSIY